MIVDDDILVPLYGKNVWHYESLGYTIPREPAKDGHKNRFVVPKGTRINVKVKDLPRGSNEPVHCVCDYCGDCFDRMYYLVLNGRKNGNLKDACNKKDCIEQKQRETTLLKYGTIDKADICEQNGTKLGRFLKYDLDYYIQEFKNHGKTLCVDMINDVDDIKVKDNLPFICDSHADAGIQYMSYDSMRTNVCCCKYGRIEACIERQSTVDISDVQKICMDRNYTLLTNKITSVDTKIEYICNRHSDYGVQTTTLYGMTHYDCNCKLCTTEKSSGENHWNWHGGINDKNDIARKSWEYKEWRTLVYKRDNFTCQCCGESSQNTTLNAHHILNFSDYEDLRYDVNNGITLCEKCHSIKYKDSFHSLYGVHNNTKEQLEEYIKNKHKVATIQS